MNSFPPGYRAAFVRATRQLRVHFYTSNTEKYLQARTVFDRYGLPLLYFRHRTDPYHEDYAAGKQELLKRAVAEVLATVSPDTIFFVEDTSVRIDALSTSTEDVPGLAVKEWFAGTTFTDFDRELRARKGSRRVVVSSDVALHLPGRTLPVFFSGATEGVIAESAPDFAPSPHYPWLTPATFNGWFIPKGSTKRLGEMTLEESWRHDFRIKALASVVERLEEYTLALNLPRKAVMRRERDIPQPQLELFDDTSIQLAVIGPICAGKSTFGQFVRQRYDVRWIEASDVVSGLAEEVPAKIAAVKDAAHRAKAILNYLGQDVVAHRVLDILRPDIESGFVITGFRTIEEIEVLRKAVPGVRVVYLDVSDRVRFQRYLQRRRRGQPPNRDAFGQIQADQRSFGLLAVAEDVADVQLSNEGTMDQFETRIQAVVSRMDARGVSAHVGADHHRFRTQLHRALTALDRSSHPLTLREVEAYLQGIGRPLRYYNANRAFKRYPELVRRIKRHGSVLRYELLAPGRVFVRLLDASLGNLPQPND
jgi:dephospho-CoA kinase/inosine/xanthosine triphosphate pyrophosphatase family protein